MILLLKILSSISSIDWYPFWDISKKIDFFENFQPGGRPAKACKKTEKINFPRNAPKWVSIEREEQGEYFYQKNHIKIVHGQKIMNFYKFTTLQIFDLSLPVTWVKVDISR